MPIFLKGVYQNPLPFFVSWDPYCVFKYTYHILLDVSTLNNRVVLYLEFNSDWAPTVCLSFRGLTFKELSYGAEASKFKVTSDLKSPEAEAEKNFPNVFTYNQKLKAVGNCEIDKVWKSSIEGHGVCKVTDVWNSLRH